MMKDKECCEGGEVTAGCMHDHCTGPKAVKKEQLDFLDALDEMDTDYEVQVYDGEEDEGCIGGACKI